LLWFLAGLCWLWIELATCCKSWWNGNVWCVLVECLWLCLPDFQTFLCVLDDLILVPFVGQAPAWRNVGQAASNKGRNQIITLVPDGHRGKLLWHVMGHDCILLPTWVFISHLSSFIGDAGNCHGMFVKLATYVCARFRPRKPPDKFIYQLFEKIDLFAHVRDWESLITAVFTFDAVTDSDQREHELNKTWRHLHQCQLGPSVVCVCIS